MARPRLIDQNDILDAAERAVVRNGAANLTLDAVAIEAGISKASVIYDYKTKHQLMKAVIERRIASEEKRVGQIIADLGAVKNAAIHGQIAAAALVPADDARAVALNIGAALALDHELRQPIEEYYSRLIAAIQETSGNSRGSMLAFLALEGLRTLEWQDFHAWPDDERRRILQDIAWLADAEPAPEKPETS